MAFISSEADGRDTQTSHIFTGVVTSGTDPVIILPIALNSLTATVSSVVVSAGLTAGTPVECKTVRNGTTYLSLWAIPAPTGTGTITVTYSGSVEYRVDAILLQGAHQTTPCPAADAVTASANGSGDPNPLSATAANLTANDMAVAVGANSITGDAPTLDSPGTETFNYNAGTLNAAMGYHAGTGAMSVTWGAKTTTDTLLVARIAAVAAAGPDLTPMYRRRPQ